MLDLASIGRRRSLQKRLDHFAAEQYGMTVRSTVFGHDCPDSVLPAGKCCDETTQSFLLRRRTVYQCDHGSVAATLQDFAQASLKRTELASFRSRVLDNNRSVSLNHRPKRKLVFSCHYNHHVAEFGEALNHGRQKGAGRTAKDRRSDTLLRPRQQGLVPSHARRLARGEDHSSHAYQAHCDLLRNLPVQELAQAAPGAAHPDIKMPEQGIDSADLVKPHFVNQFLEDQRVIGKQIHPPLPVIKANRTGNDLPYLAGVAAADQSMLIHLPGALLYRERVPVLVFTSTAIHRIKADVPVLRNFREQPRSHRLALAAQGIIDRLLPLR